MTSSRAHRSQAEAPSVAARASRWVRVVNLSGLTDVFLVAAVTALVGVRSFLAALGYPQVGGGGLHISHMLWGGLLMLVALLMQVLYIGRSNRLLVAIIGGAGFGLFIDELGKFITSNNDYFFQPTFALIYVFMVALYLAVKVGIKHRGLKPHEYVVNAIDYLQDAALGRLSESGKASALQLLERAGEAPMAAEIRDLLEQAPVRAGDTHSGGAGLAAWYERVHLSKAAMRVAAAAFVLQPLVVFAEFGAVGILVNHAWQARGSGVVDHLAGDAVGLSGVALIELGTGLACSVLAAISLRRLGHDRLRAYRSFEVSVLLSLLVTQVLAFFESWEVALVCLLLSLPVWIILRLVIEQEEHLAARADLQREPT